MSGFLAAILDRKRRENERRHAHLALHDPTRLAHPRRDPEATIRALRRASTGEPRAIAEVKRASPSEGTIRAWQPGQSVAIAKAYERAGAAAISVLCDRAGFGGGVLDLRRVVSAVDRPVLFKEFVLDPIQVDLAASVGASLVLLLVRALNADPLVTLMRRCRSHGLVPVVEAADAREVAIARELGAEVIGVNARDLATFRVDPKAARAALADIEEPRVAIYMSGIASRQDLLDLAGARCDAVLIGSHLMRAPDPGHKLAQLLGTAT
ncbi:MAG: indole-3-glycerol-phosphate synthase [Sandaracinaceae bacterium]